MTSFDGRAHVSFQRKKSPISAKVSLELATVLGLYPPANDNGRSYREALFARPACLATVAMPGLDGAAGGTGGGAVC